MDQFAGLLGHGLRDRRMRVTEGIHGHAGYEIQVLIAVLVE